MTAPWVALSLCLVLSAVHPAKAISPEKVVAAFCRADGMGDRLSPNRLSTLGSIVGWHYEPAWDRVVLIRGYQAGTVRRKGDAASLEVQYTCSGEIRPGKVVPVKRFEAHTFRLAPDGRGGWILLGPPPVPHVFASRVDPEKLAAAMNPAGGVFVSNSAFVWHTLRTEGKEIPYADTKALLQSPFLTEVEEPAAEDLVLYLDGEEPYHVAIVTGDNEVVSATMNAGIAHTPMDAFAGTPRFFRPGTRNEAGQASTTPGAVPNSEATSKTAPAADSPLRDSTATNGTVSSSAGRRVTSPTPTGNAGSGVADPGSPPYPPVAAAPPECSSTVSPTPGPVAATPDRRAVGTYVP